jgi:hypothetical protein
MIQRLKLMLFFIIPLFFGTLFMCNIPQNDGSNKKSIENQYLNMKIEMYKEKKCQNRSI